MKDALFFNQIYFSIKFSGHLKKECPELSDERRKELQELFTMKVERKGQGTGRKKNKRKAAEALEAGVEGGAGPQKRQKFENRPKKILKDKTGFRVILKFVVVIGALSCFGWLYRNNEEPL